MYLTKVTVSLLLCLSSIIYSVDCLFFAGRPKQLSCPPTQLFRPCECYLHADHMKIIRCGGHQSYDLKPIFTALSAYLPKDDKHFHMFYLNNTGITSLENVFQDITFDYIYFDGASSLQSIDAKAFDITGPFVKEVRAFNTQLKQSSLEDAVVGLSNLLHLTVSNVAQCPPEELLKPCRCQHKEEEWQWVQARFTRIICGEEREEDLRSAYLQVPNRTEEQVGYYTMRRLQIFFERLSESLNKINWQKRFDEFVLQNSPIPELPRNVFNDIIFYGIRIDNCPKLTTIHPMAFTITAPFVQELLIRRTKLSNDRHKQKDIFNAITSLENLRALYLHWSGLMSVPHHAFRPLKGKFQRKLVKVSIKYTKSDRTALRMIGSYAFYYLSNLKTIDLSLNSIVKVYRNAFSLRWPSNEVLEVILAGNNLTETSIDPSAFLEAQRPVHVVLGQGVIGNPHLHHLDESVFRLFLKENNKNKVKLFSSKNTKGLNRILCDCKSKWMFDAVGRIRQGLEDVMCTSNANTSWQCLPPCLVFGHDLLHCGSNQSFQFRDVFSALSHRLLPHERHFKRFVLSNAQIETLPDHSFGDITFEHLEFDGCTKLKYIDPEAFINNEDKVQRIVVRQTTELSRSKQNLLNFALFKNLTHLDLSFDGEFRLFNTSFESNHTTNKTLYIRLNRDKIKAESIEMNAFNGAKRPLHLFFDSYKDVFDPIGCQLMRLDEEIYAPFLASNPFNQIHIMWCPIVCDCSIKWLFDAPKDWWRRVDAGDQTVGVQCADHRSLYRYSDSEFRGCPKTNLLKYFVEKQSTTPKTITTVWDYITTTGPTTITTTGPTTITTGRPETTTAIETTIKIQLPPDSDNEVLPQNQSFIKTTESIPQMTTVLTENPEITTTELKINASYGTTLSSVSEVTTALSSVSKDESTVGSTEFSSVMGITDIKTTEKSIEDNLINSSTKYETTVKPMITLTTGLTESELRLSSSTERFDTTTGPSIGFSGTTESSDSLVKITEMTTNSTEISETTVQSVAQNDSSTTFQTNITSVTELSTIQTTRQKTDEMSTTLSPEMSETTIGLKTETTFKSTLGSGIKQTETTVGLKSTETPEVMTTITKSDESLVNTFFTTTETSDQKLMTILVTQRSDLGITGETNADSMFSTVHSSTGSPELKQTTQMTITQDFVNSTELPSTSQIFVEKTTDSRVDTHFNDSTDSATDIVKQMTTTSTPKSEITTEYKVKDILVGKSETTTEDGMVTSAVTSATVDETTVNTNTEIQTKSTISSEDLKTESINEMKITTKIPLIINTQKSDEVTVTQELTSTIKTIENHLNTKLDTTTQTSDESYGSSEKTTLNEFVTQTSSPITTSQTYTDITKDEGKDTTVDSITESKTSELSSTTETSIEMTISDQNLSESNIKTTQTSDTTVRSSQTEPTVEPIITTDALTTSKLLDGRHESETTTSEPIVTTIKIITELTTNTNKSSDVFTTEENITIPSITTEIVSEISTTSADPSTITINEIKISETLGSSPETTVQSVAQTESTELPDIQTTYQKLNDISVTLSSILSKTTINLKTETKTQSDVTLEAITESEIMSTGSHDMSEVVTTTEKIINESELLTESTTQTITQTQFNDISVNTTEIVSQMTTSLTTDHKTSDGLPISESSETTTEYSINKLTEVSNTEITSIGVTGNDSQTTGVTTDISNTSTKTEFEFKFENNPTISSETPDVITPDVNSVTIDVNTKVSEITTETINDTTTTAQSESIRKSESELSLFTEMPEMTTIEHNFNSFDNKSTKISETTVDLRTESQTQSSVSTETVNELIVTTEMPDLMTTNKGIDKTTVAVELTTFIRPTNQPIDTTDPILRLITTTEKLNVNSNEENISETTDISLNTINLMKHLTTTSMPESQSSITTINSLSETIEDVVNKTVDLGLESMIEMITTSTPIPEITTEYKVKDSFVGKSEATTVEGMTSSAVILDETTVNINTETQTKSTISSEDLKTESINDMKITTKIPLIINTQKSDEVSVNQELTSTMKTKTEDNVNTSIDSNIGLDTTTQTSDESSVKITLNEFVTQTSSPITTSQTYTEITKDEGKDTTVDSITESKTSELSSTTETSIEMTISDQNLSESNIKTIQTSDTTVRSSQTESTVEPIITTDALTTTKLLDGRHESETTTSEPIVTTIKTNDEMKSMTTTESSDIVVNEDKTSTEFVTEINSYSTKGREDLTEMTTISLPMTETIGKGINLSDINNNSIGMGSMVTTTDKPILIDTTVDLKSPEIGFTETSGMSTDMTNISTKTVFEFKFEINPTLSTETPELKNTEEKADIISITTDMNTKVTPDVNSVTIDMNTKVSEMTTETINDTTTTAQSENTSNSISDLSSFTETPEMTTTEHNLNDISDNKSTKLSKISVELRTETQTQTSISTPTLRTDSENELIVITEIPDLITTGAKSEDPEPTTKTVKSYSITTTESFEEAVNQSLNPLNTETNALNDVKSESDFSTTYNSFVETTANSFTTNEINDNLVNNTSNPTTETSF